MKKPRSFDCVLALKRLAIRKPQVADDPQIAWILRQDGTEDSLILAAVQKLLLRPDLTIAVAGCFRPRLIEIVNGLVHSLRHLSQIQDNSLVKGNVSEIIVQRETFDIPADNKLKWGLGTHEYAGIALSRLLELAPHVLRIVLEYYSFAPAPFERLLQPSRAQAADAPLLLDVVQACYRYLLLQPKIFRDLWDWSIFIDLLQWTGLDDTAKSHSKSGLDVRWCAVQILSVVLKFSDAKARVVSSNTSLIEEGEYFDCLMRWAEVSDEVPLERAGLYFECTLEDEMVDSIDVSEPPQEWSSAFKEFKPNIYRPFAKEASFIEVCGIELPIKTGTGVMKSRCFVTTTTAVRNMESVVLALSQRQPILLEGPVGAGKSCLIRELANLTGNTDIIFTHLDDQMDSKTLLGNYVCTEVPGEFKWQPGPLTQAVIEGMWVVFEDIDKAPAEILSALVPLLEDRKLYIAGRGETIVAADDFCIFSTVTKTKLGSAPMTLHGKDMLGNLWRKVVIDAPSDEELEVIVKTRFPSLSTFTPKLIGVLSTVTSATSQSSAQACHSGIGAAQFAKQYSTRDLIKWCKRIAVLEEEHFKGRFLSGSVLKRIFIEAVDCFAQSISVPADRQLVEVVIAEKLQMTADAVSSYRVHKPSLKETPSSLQVGRATIHRSMEQGKAQTTRVFAQSGHFMRMLERIAVCVQHNEPVLLVGETGTGKTSLVQHLARKVSIPLVVLNLSQQSDSMDLLGGYKPVEAQGVCIPIFNAFSALFGQTFSNKKNAELMDRLRRLLSKKKWDMFLKDLRLSVNTVAKLVDASEQTVGESPTKRRKKFSNITVNAWRVFQSDLSKAERQVKAAKAAFAFSFVEGALVKALKAGHWVLLDEVNLAPVETLERLTGVLEGEDGALCLTERGDVETVEWHPEFRIFACMNPATDVGKRLLPTALRNRFSEFFVDELTDREELLPLVEQYLEDTVPHPPVDEIVEFYLRARCEADARLLDGANQKPHYSLRSLARALEYTKAAMPTYGFQRSLYDGMCMSFLTLLDRPSAETMEQLILEVLFDQKGKAASQFLKSILKAPSQPTSRHVLFEQFWVESGDVEPTASILETCKRYVSTPSIREHLKNLARAVFIRKNPVLLQGPTSSGKTSMIEYLASRTGHRFVRINNHEHTDLQEYLGSYVTDSSGKLVFQEGILVQAVRNGHWIVLDELNLAPSDVLEALNRLLDDNRELFVPELQMTIKPNPHFMLFATQNPPGVYGGRKPLSRAFRNRFIELHIDDIPDYELQTILEKRCEIPGSYASKMVEVMKDLQRHRQGSKIFAGKHGFITPRDLFRWAERRSNGYKELAMDGYMLLAERLRNEEEKVVVQQVLEKHMRVKIHHDDVLKTLTPQKLQEIQDCLSTSSFGKIVWTKSMTRVFNLVENCIRHNEPVLLVGETGCGKTTVCQILAELLHRKLHILNCHQHSETADFIGGLRPVRDRGTYATKFVVALKNLISTNVLSEDIINQLSFRIEDADLTISVIQGALSKLHNRRRSQASLRSGGHCNFTGEDDAERIAHELSDLRKEYQSLFVWQDGPLVTAMRGGDYFLVDEISLADDSVLERLNSVLDPNRILVLAEKGGLQVEELKANLEFRLLATMNPGGDFGKRELSPALRNRFTEIWVPPISDLSDLQRIVVERFDRPELLPLKDPLLQFWQWFQRQGDQGRSLSVRDLLSWVTFINTTSRSIGHTNALVHGAFLVFFDGIGLGTGLSSTATQNLRRRCLHHLLELLPKGEKEAWQADVHAESKLMKPVEISVEDWTVDLLSQVEESRFGRQADKFGIRPFYIPRGDFVVPSVPFEMAAPTTSWNAFRVLRAMQLSKPVLLEGSPGVGKTSLVSAIALSSGNRLVRINLSEQTEVVDLFGSDMPVDGGNAGDFQWSDGAFLQALQAGDWVLLDELNLASQSVLEGLNACLDHRGEVYIPELGKSFKCPNTFRVFACQNPISQGGGRNGLPKSFLNRFTKVYVDALGEDDLLYISEALHPSISKALLKKMVRFNSRLHEDIMVNHKYGHSGAPWEFNLRDILRWCDLLEGSVETFQTRIEPETFLDVVYLQRLRTMEDRLSVLDLFTDIFGTPARIQTYPLLSVNPEYVHVGQASLRRRLETQFQRDSFKQIHMLPGMGNRLQALMHCVQQGWMCILVGPSGSGKTNLVRSLAALSGNTLHEFATSTATDTTELLGCFEQHDPFRHLQEIVERIELSVARTCEHCFSDQATPFLANRKLELLKNVLSSWATFQKFSKSRHKCIGWAESKDMQAWDPRTVELLLQTLEHLQQAWEICEIQNLNVILHPNRLLMDLKDVKKTIEQGQRLGRFEWIDGALLRAIENGDWVVLDNANLCSPTVLDRLNPLLEPNGTILLNERGLVNGKTVVVRAHPSFRLFLTVDPSHGEVSRAMRNRGVEIFMLQPDWIFSRGNKGGAKHASNNNMSQDAFSLVIGAGIPSDSLTRAILSAYNEISNFLGSGRGGADNFLRDLSRWISLLIQLLERGANLFDSLTRSWIQTFVRRLESVEARSEALGLLCSHVRQLVPSTQAWNESCFVAGGWPRPQNLEMFSLKSVEACVERDAAYVEFLVAQQVASGVSKSWDSIPRPDLERLLLLQAENHLVYFPAGVLQKYWNPLRTAQIRDSTVPKFDVESHDMDHVLLHACLWMLERGTFLDMKLRIRWVEHCAKRTKTAARILTSLGLVLRAEQKHNLVKQLQAAWNRLEAASGGAVMTMAVPYLSPGMPLSSMEGMIPNNDEKYKDAWMDVAHVARQVLALRKSLLQWQLEDEAYQYAATGRIVSPLTLSYLHHTNGDVKLYQLPVPTTILQYAYPLFNVVRIFEEEVLDFLNFHRWEAGGGELFAELQKRHKVLWTVLRQRNFSRPVFLFHWMRFKQILLDIYELFADTSLTTKKVVEELRYIIQSLDGYSSQSRLQKPLLWKHGGHPLLFPSKDLNDLNMEIRSICEYPLEGLDQDKDLWPVAFDTELRRLVVQGLSMSMCLRQNDLHRRSEKGSTTSAISTMTQETQLDCKQILQMLLQRLAVKNRSPKDGSELDIYEAFSKLKNAEQGRINVPGCSCADRHVKDDVLLRSSENTSSCRDFLLELVVWLDHITVCQDNVLLGAISAAVSVYMIDGNASQAFEGQILDSTSMSDLLEFSLTSSSRSPIDLVPHQHLLWIVDTLSSKPPDFALNPQDIAHEMWFRWHRAVWRRRPCHLDFDQNFMRIEGASRLFIAAESIMLSNIIGRGGAFKEHSTGLRQLRVASLHLWNTQSRKCPNVTTSNLHCCSSLLMQILLAHKKSFALENLSELHDIFDALKLGHTTALEVHGCNDDEGIIGSLAKLEALIKSSQHEGVVAMTDSHLLRCANLLYKTSWNKLSASDTLSQLGQVWLLIGLTRVSLILPADGCDPVAKHGFKHELQSSELEDLKLEWKVRRECDLSVGASGHSPSFSQMQEKIEELQERLAVSSVKVIPRPQHPSFGSFCEAVQRFLQTSAGSERLMTFWRKLHEGRSIGESAADEAVAWQGTAQNFIDHLMREFPAYRDFAQPVQQGIYELKFGLSLSLAAFAQQSTFKAGGAPRDENALSDLVCILMRFPSQPHVKLLSSCGWNGVKTSAAAILVSGMTKDVVSWAASFLRSPTKAEEVMKMEMKLNVLQVALLKAGEEVLQSQLITVADLNLLDSIFSSFSSLWFIMRECQAERQRDKEEVFKYSTTTYSMDADPGSAPEEEGATTLDYKSDFSWLDVDPDDAEEYDEMQVTETGKEPTKEDSVAMGKAWSRMQDILVESVTRMHQNIFAAPRLLEDQPLQEVTEMERIYSFRLSYDTGKQLLPVLGHCLPAFLDEQLRPAHLMRVNLEHQVLSGGSGVEGSTATSDVYAENQPSEVALMVDPLQVLSKRIMCLLVEWPEHPILQQLLKICQTLLSFPLSTSVMKALTGVELLLSKAQSWEENAAKHVSVGGELDSLSRLVTRWRKLELESWLSLLERTEKTYALRSNNMWFSLYNVLHRRCEEEMDKYVEDTISSVEEFMRSATFGEYRARLNLVKAFFCQFSVRMRATAPVDGLSMESMEKVWRVLYNVYKYYHQFLPVLDSIVVSEKRSIEAELKDFVRLSKWDDRSHYTMTRSSEKSHRTLQKLVKKYADLLRRSMGDLLHTQATQRGSHNLSVMASFGEDVDGANCRGANAVSSKKRETGFSAEEWQHRCDAQLGAQLGEVKKDSASHVSEEYPCTKAFYELLDGHVEKMGPLLGASVFSRASSSHRLNGVEALELLSTTIITRATDLKTEKKTLVKQKALVDLLRALRQIGLSHHTSVIPKTQRDRQSWLLLPPAEAKCDDIPEIGSNEWTKSSDYYFKNMALIQRLEWARPNFNKALKLRQVEFFSKYAAHLLFIQQRQRKMAHEFSANVVLLGELAQALRNCGKDDAHFPNQEFMRKWMWQQKNHFDVLHQVFAETLSVFKSSENIQSCPSNSMRIEAGAVRSVLQDLSVQLDECKARLDYHLVQRQQFACLQKQCLLWPLAYTPPMLKDLSRNFEVLRKTRERLISICGAETSSKIKCHCALMSLQQLLEKGYGMLKEFELERSQCRQSGGLDPFKQHPALSNLYNELEKQILLAVQKVYKIGNDFSTLRQDLLDGSANEEAEGLPDTLFSYEKAIMDQIDSLRLSSICQAALDVLALSGKVVGDSSLLGASAVAVGALLSSMHVPLDMIHAAAVHLLSDLFSLHKSVTKFGYILSNLFVALVSDGFCKTEAEGEQEESSKFEEASGTGMGEGEGKVDVSDKIENEEQVLGGAEKTEDIQQQGEGQEKANKGIEMEEEFDGDMIDLSDDDQGEDDGAEDEEHLDSKMGEAGADDDVVDSKLWENEENTDQNPGSNEKYDKDSSLSGAKPEDIEMRGREGEALDDAGAEENERHESGPESEIPHQYESPTMAGNEEDKDGLETDHDPQEQNRGVEQTAEETLDLPQNLDLDGQDEETEIGVDEQGASTRDPDDQNGDEADLPDEMNIDEETSGHPEESSVQEQAELEPSSTENENHEDMDVDIGSPEKNDGENNEKPEPRSGVDASTQQHDMMQPFDNQEAPVELSNGSDQSSQKYSNQGVANSLVGLYSEPTSSQRQLPEKGSAEDPSREESAPTQTEQVSFETENGANKTSLSEPSSSRMDLQSESLPDVNPYRSLGDAMKQWKERLRLLDSGEAPLLSERSEEPPSKEELASEEGTGDYEFVPDNEDSTAQALGSATKEQLDKTSEAIAHHNDQEGTEDDARQDMKRTEKLDNKRDMVDELNVRVNPKQGRLGDANPQTSKDVAEDIVKDINGLTVDDDTASAMYSADGSVVSLRNPENETPLSRELISVNPENWSEEEIHNMRKDLEASGLETGDAEEARSIWQKYEYLTARLSQELAEQLRLILEPTLATKLQGDYRTGKRINMKKIIPYIASSFRKDKIWLRRTKPSKRQYQVVVAIDDSRSMSEAHCGHLAMEALFTICRALSKLEIGEMAVASFGRKGNVRLLHDFDQPFSSEAGINMIRQFSFSQDNTIADKPMVDLLQFLTRMLDMSTKSSAVPAGNVNLQQLVLIIADGRFHEKESLRRCIREASSRRQLLAFIVLDNPKASILDTQSVSFATGAPSFTKYLDSFPFPYYILLRDIEALPQTLADLMRQWFELAQNSIS